MKRKVKIIKVYNSHCYECGGIHEVVGGSEWEEVDVNEINDIRRGLVIVNGKSLDYEQYVLIEECDTKEVISMSLAYLRDKIAEDDRKAKKREKELEEKKKLAAEKRKQKEIDKAKKILQEAGEL